VTTLNCAVAEIAVRQQCHPLTETASTHNSSYEG